MLVSRPSHTHQAPQVGRPQMEPVARQIAVKAMPGIAAARAAIAASGCFHTSRTRLEMAMALHPPMPSHAEGTWMKRMRTVSPINLSGGTANRPQASAAPVSSSPAPSNSGVSHLASDRKRVGLA